MNEEIMKKSLEANSVTYAYALKEWCVHTTQSSFLASVKPSIILDSDDEAVDTADAINRYCSSELHPPSSSPLAVAEIAKTTTINLNCTKLVMLEMLSKFVCAKSRIFRTWVSNCMRQKSVIRPTLLSLMRRPLDMMREDGDAIDSDDAAADGHILRANAHGSIIRNRRWFIINSSATVAPDLRPHPPPLPPFALKDGDADYDEP
ncbi:hypothetical protein PIB30_057687 [Stylosanthes scabra]|uniref:Uncharacterized protein n=1 Tax=Stylosanthes scabra TaxID=79078 RepID=A0ABU6TJK6_9FABA|nr:hypothetical protein [Stylosanthes scabra]